MSPSLKVVVLSSPPDCCKTEILDSRASSLIHPNPTQPQFSHLAMGNPITYQIVSHTDTIVFLKNPSMVFAEWGEPVLLEIRRDPWITSTSSASRPLSKKEKKKLNKRTIPSQPIIRASPLLQDEVPSTDSTGPSDAPIVFEESPNQADQSPSRRASSNTEHAVHQSTPGETTSSSDLPEVAAMGPHEAGSVIGVADKLEEEDGIRFKVCAGNLMSASPWFSRALERDGWSESIGNSTDGCFRISAEGWDEEAFLILMNVLHLRNNKVPRSLSLEMLAKLALLADYYEFRDSVELIVDVWVADLRVKNPIPETYCRDLILWIWISWTFKLSHEFKHATAVAITQSPEPIRDLGLPIPSWITGKYCSTHAVWFRSYAIDEMDDRRYRSIESILFELAEQVRVYRSTTYTCPIDSVYSFRCGSMLLGALAKQIDSSNLDTPQLERPYSKRTFDDLCATVGSMKSETWLHGPYTDHDCNIITAVKLIVNTAAAKVAGLDLKSSVAEHRMPVDC